jgi:hypothetical protein
MNSVLVWAKNHHLVTKSVNPTMLFGGKNSTILQYLEGKKVQITRFTNLGHSFKRMSPEYRVPKNYTFLYDL